MKKGFIIIAILFAGGVGRIAARGCVVIVRNRIHTTPGKIYSLVHKKNVHGEAVFAYHVLNVAINERF